MHVLFFCFLFLSLLSFHPTRIAAANLGHAQEVERVHLYGATTRSASSVERRGASRASRAERGCERSGRAAPSGSVGSHGADAEGIKGLQSHRVQVPPEDGLGGESTS